MKNPLKTLSTLVGLALAGAAAHAQSAPMMVHYQGRLTQPNGLPLTSPTASVAFEIFPSASGGTRLWPPAGPLSTYTVILRNGGIFSVMLGDTSIPGMPALTQSVFQQGVVYLQISIAGNPVGPRQPIVSVPWSILSQQANLAVNVVDGAITTPKLADGSVVATKLADGAVGTVKLANGSVTTAKIFDGTISENDIASNAITGQKIADGAVTPLKLALDAAGLPRVTGGVAIMEGQSMSLGGSGYTSNVRFVSHGRIRIVGDGGGSAGIWLNTGTGDTGFIGASDSSAVGFYGGAGAGWGMIMKADTGRIGIGTTQPSERLDVNGNAIVRGSVTATTDGYFSGNVAIGATNANGHRLAVNGNLNITDAIIGNNGFILIQDPSQLTFNPLNSWGTVRFYGPNFVVNSQWTGIFGEPEIGFRLKCHGPLYATSFHTTSDRRAKTELHEIERPLQTLLQLHGMNFRFKREVNSEFPNGIRYGFIAQDVEKVIPQWVTSGTKFKTLSTSEFDALATEAIREQQNQIDTLRKHQEALTRENERLRRQNAGFEARLRALESKAAR